MRAYTAARTGKDAVSRETLLEGWERYTTTDKYLRGFVQYPATWLRNRCWEDQPAIVGNGYHGNGRDLDLDDDCGI